jgi:hypothetical protein
MKIRAINHSKIRLLAISVLLLASLSGYAQCDSIRKKPPRLTERRGMIGISHTDILDTYLSQETFKGTELRYVSQTQRRRVGSRVSSEVTHHIILSSAGTRGNNNSLLTAMYNFKMGWHYNWQLGSPDLKFKVGGLADGTLGGSYNTRNSNNPAQARLSLSIDPSAKVSWDFHIKRHPLALNYEMSMPLIGLAFSPNYGQSYYEIFSEGNYDHNIVVTSPFSGPQLQMRLTLDFRLWRSTFSVGYLGDIRQMEANNLKYHQFSHGLVLGWKY